MGKIPINEEFPELDEPGCDVCNYYKYIFNSLVEKGYIFENFAEKMREAGESYWKKSLSLGRKVCHLSTPKKLELAKLGFPHTSGGAPSQPKLLNY